MMLGIMSLRREWIRGRVWTEDVVRERSNERVLVYLCARSVWNVSICV